MDFSLFVTFFDEFLIVEIWPSGVFSSAPETLANDLVATGSVSLPELYICGFDWLDPHLFSGKLYSTLLFL